MFGLLLVVVGALMLLQKFNILTGDFWGYIWAIIIILLGLKLMMKGKCCGGKKKGNVPPPPAGQ
jgi:predicted membrane protein